MNDNRFNNYWWYCHCKCSYNFSGNNVLMKKFVYLAICTRLANAILPNGENAHCTVKEPDWWEKHIIKSNKNKIHTEVHWYGNHNDYRKYYTSS